MAESGFDDMEITADSDVGYESNAGEEEISNLLKERNDLMEKADNTKSYFTQIKYAKEISAISKKVDATQVNLDRYSYATLSNYYDETSTYIEKVRKYRDSIVEKGDFKRVELLKELKRAEMELESIDEELMRREKRANYSDASDQELTDIKNDLLIMDKKLRSKYGDNEETPNRVKELYEHYRTETGLIEEELDRRFEFKDTNGDDIIIEGFDNSDDSMDDTGKATVKAPKVPFVESNNEFEKVTDGSYEVAFKGTEEIEKRLAALKDFRVKYKAEREIERVKLILKKVKTLYKKDMPANNKVTREIIDRSFVTDSGGIRFKPIGVSGDLLANKLILKRGTAGSSNLVFSKDASSKIAIKQFKELVEKLPDISKKVEEPIEK